MLTLLAIYAVGATLVIPLVLRQSVKYKQTLLDVRSENAQLSHRLLDAVEDRITDWDVDYYLENRGLVHQWRKLSRSHVNGTHRETKVRYKDTLQTDICDRCGLVRRTWVHGLGAMDYSHLAGYSRGGHKFPAQWGNEKAIRCVSTDASRPLLPGEKQKLLGQ